LIVAVVLLFVLSAKLKKWIVLKLLARSNVDIGVRQATASLVRYVVIAIGLLVIINATGMDLTPLNVLAGTVGIGIGFGLQNIANNFISGLIILFERPMKVGDRIEVAGVEGDVTEVGPRSTKVLTNDNITIIIPNSAFITDNVVNWSYNDKKVRFRIPVAVSYDSDVRLVTRLLLEVAKENRDVLEDPEPAVRFMEFGDSALVFELRPWSTTLIHRRGRLVSAINFAIFQKFSEHGIEIPFPQREVRIRRNPPSATSEQAPETDSNK
jgi:small-conductance mechanosensitive channel